MTPTGKSNRPARTDGTEDPTRDPEKLFAVGRRLLQERRFTQALVAFKGALDRKPEELRYASFYGLCLVKTGRNPAEGKRLCERAAQEGFYRSELLANLATVLLTMGDRRGAVAALRRGLAVDPEDRELAELLNEIGPRRRPVFPFLKRRHLLNRLAGRVRHTLRGRPSKA